MFNRIQAILRGCGQTFYLPGPAFGAVLLAILLLNPRVAVAGLIAVASAYLLARLIGMEQLFLQAGYYTFNPLLVGCSLGFKFEFGPAWLLLTVLSGALTLGVTMLTAHLLVTKLRLPILSVPYSLTSAMIYLVVARHSTVGAAPLSLGAWADADFGMPLWLVGFFRSFGAVVFSPNVVAGILIAALVAAASRVLLLLALAGFCTGVATRALLMGSWNAAVMQPDNFNMILIAMALGGLFLTPSLRSCLLALVAAAITPLALDAIAAFWAPLGVPTFTLPYCTLLIGTLVILRLANYAGLLVGIGATPEEIRENAILLRSRYPGTLRSLRLPFCGKWTVWQGFAGKWTHQGLWQHAYDFVITDDDRRTHKGPGSQLTDYFCYRMPIISPVRGKVVRVVDNLPDNPPGSVSGGSSGSNWGNLVLLYDARGFYVEISHFSPQSIRVKEGDWVEVGAALGLCGNSGNSPQPHIHIQAQAVETIGAATLPFSFASYQQGISFHSNDLPPEREQVEPVYLDKQLDERTSFVLDDELTYDVLRRGEPVDRVTLKVKLAADGTYFFETARGRLYFGKHESTYYFYRIEGKDPYLRMLFMASPRLSLAYRKSLRWIDYVPAGVALSGVRRFVARLGAILFPNLARVEVIQTFVDANQIRSVARSPLFGRDRVARIELDRECGFAAVQSGDLEMRRCLRGDDGEPTPLKTVRRTPQRLPAALAACFLFLVLFVPLSGADRAPADNDTTREAIQQSVESEKAKDYAKAVATLQQEYAAHPNSYTLNARLAWLSYLAKDYAKADAYYQAAAGIAPKSIEAENGLALGLLAEGKYADAETAARKVLSLDPGNLYGKLRLEAALRMQSKIKEAVDAIQPMLTAYPGNAYVAYEAALLKATKDPAADSLKQTEPAFDAKTAEAWQASLQAETDGKFSDAIDALKDVARAHTKSYLINVRLGYLSSANKDYPNAEAYYEQASKVAPASLEAKIGHTSALLAEYKFQQAKATAAQIRNADSLNYYGNLWQAYSMRVLGDGKKAEPILDRLTSAYPTDPNALIELALVRAAIPQRKTNARDLLKQVLALDPTNTTASKKLEELK